MTDQVETFQSMLEGKQQETKTATPDQGAQNQQNAGQNNQAEDLLSQITNEQGEPKYKTVEDAIAALRASQEHIATLERENQEYRGKTQEAATIDKILEQLDSTKRNSDDNQSDFSMEDIKNLVSQTVEEREALKTAQRNQETVVSSLRDKYGEKATEEFRAKAQELGLSVDEMVGLSARSPKAVLQYFDISSSGRTNKNLQGSVNSEQFQQYNQPAEKPKPIMYGASTQDLVNSWKRAGEALNNQ